jgi:hypothetical protein
MYAACAKLCVGDIQLLGHSAASASSSIAGWVNLLVVERTCVSTKKKRSMKCCHEI